MNYLLYICLLLITRNYAYILSTDTRNLKLCKNCKHFVENNLNEKFGTCKKYSLVNEVTGDTISSLACIVRKSPFLCTIAGRGYESKFNKKLDEFERIIDF